MSDEVLQFALKPFLPKIKKYLKGGAIDSFLNELKNDIEIKYDIGEDESIDFIISKEDGFWFFSSIVLKEDGKIDIKESIPMDIVIESLIKIK